MSKEQQKFSVSYANDAVFAEGLRDFLEYRDLGIETATNGQFRAHVVRVKKDHPGDHDMHTTGLHQHLCDFQMFFVLKGWVRFIYDGQDGEFTFRAGDCVLQPAGIVHNEIMCSDDFELIEIYSPAVHETRPVAAVPSQAETV
jgi:mannose-6-phosphate isomerase-like protein (cupin superfamily)